MSRFDHIQSITKSTIRCWYLTDCETRTLMKKIMKDGESAAITYNGKSWSVGGKKIEVKKDYGCPQKLLYGIKHFFKHLFCCSYAKKHTASVEKIQIVFLEYIEKNKDRLEAKNAMEDQARKEKEKAKSNIRNYKAEVTEVEKSHLSYIVNTLGNNSSITLGIYALSLKNTGKLIDHLHPLKFLLTIFTDKVMKKSISELRGRPLSWKGFMDGISKSFIKEAQLENIQATHINHFAVSLGLNAKLLQPFFEEKKWEKLVIFLIENISNKQ